jgi:hypothetical protein
MFRGEGRPQSNSRRLQGTFILLHKEEMLQSMVPSPSGHPEIRREKGGDRRRGLAIREEPFLSRTLYCVIVLYVRWVLMAWGSMMCWRGAGGARTAPRSRILLSAPPSFELRSFKNLYLVTNTPFQTL